MKNSELIIKKNSAKKKVEIKRKDGETVLNLKAKNFNADNINEFISMLKKVINQQKIKKEIVVLLDFEKFADMLVNVIFENIIYTLIAKYKFNVIFRYSQKFRDSNKGAGFVNTLLARLIARKIDTNKFCEQYLSKVINEREFRELISYNNVKDNYLGRLNFDITNCIQNSGITRSYATNIANIVAELVDNANEHASSDVLIMINIDDTYEESTGDDCWAVNVVVLNYGEKLLFSGIKAKINTYDTNTVNNKYIVVKQAFQNHKKFFDEYYTEEDFFNITTFQHDISGRDGEFKSGGTGLPVLLESILKNSYDSNCYVMSGNNVIHFIRKYLNSREGWYAFNENGNYVDSKPACYVKEEKEAKPISKSLTFLPGTAYNLQFIKKKEKNNE